MKRSTGVKVGFGLFFLLALLLTGMALNVVPDWLGIPAFFVVALLYLGCVAVFNIGGFGIAGIVERRAQEKKEQERMDAECARLKKEREMLEKAGDLIVRDIEAVEEGR